MDEFNDDPISYEFEVPFTWSFLMPILNSNQLKDKMDQWALVMDQVKQSFITKTLMEELKLSLLMTHKQNQNFLNEKTVHDEEKTVHDEEKTVHDDDVKTVHDDEEYIEDNEPFVISQRVKVSSRMKQVTRCGTASESVRKNNGKCRQVSKSVYRKQRYEIFRKMKEIYDGDTIPSNKDLNLLSLKMMKPYLLTWKYGRQKFSKRESMDGYHSIFEHHLLQDLEEIENGGDFYDYVELYNYHNDDDYYNDDLHNDMVSYYSHLSYRF